MYVPLQKCIPWLPFTMWLLHLIRFISNKALPALLKCVANRLTHCDPSNLCTCLQKLPLRLFCHNMAHQKFPHKLVKVYFSVFRTSWSTQKFPSHHRKDLSIFFRISWSNKTVELLYPPLIKLKKKVDCLI